MHLCLTSSCIVAALSYMSHVWTAGMDRRDDKKQNNNGVSVSLTSWKRPKAKSSHDIWFFFFIAEFFVFIFCIHELSGKPGVPHLCYINSAELVLVWDELSGYLLLQGFFVCIFVYQLSCVCARAIPAHPPVLCLRGSSLSLTTVFFCVDIVLSCCR